MVNVILIFIKKVDAVSKDNSAKDGRKVINISESDILNMAKIGVAEAGVNASPAHQAACGAITVLNRVNHVGFAKSVEGVIFEQNSRGEYQFEPVANGKIDKITPNDKQIATIIAALDTLKADKTAVGAFPDEYLQIGYFSNPKTTAKRGSSHPSHDNIIGSLAGEGHQFNDIRMFNRDLPINQNYDVAYSSGAQKLVDKYRNTPEYHAALQSFNEKFDLSIQTKVYANLQEQGVQIASLNGANKQALPVQTVDYLLNNLTLQGKPFTFPLNGSDGKVQPNGFDFADITPANTFLFNSPLFDKLLPPPKRQI